MFEAQQGNTKPGKFGETLSGIGGAYNPQTGSPHPPVPTFSSVLTDLMDQISTLSDAINQLESYTTPLRRPEDNRAGAGPTPTRAGGGDIITAIQVATDRVRECRIRINDLGASFPL